MTLGEKRKRKPFQQNLITHLEKLVGASAPALRTMSAVRDHAGQESDQAECPLALRQEMGYLLVEAQGEAMTEPRIELPQGTLDLLILRTLALEPQHGWAISERIHQISSEVLQVRQGSLYPALHRLQRRGWIKARWGASENNRRAKYYELTKTGRQQLEAEKDAWGKLTAAVAQVLGEA
jgi:PadR family transcriptional regulator, regulatory protein PadR